METEDFLILAGAAQDPLEPGGEALVQFRSLTLWHPVVRGMSNELVTEAECFLADELGLIGTDQVAPGEARQEGAQATVDAHGSELGQRSYLEHLPLHRAPLKRCSVLS